MRAGPDIRALVAGLAIVALGGVSLLAALDAIEMTFGAFAPIACAAVGVILLANGLSRRQ